MARLYANENFPLPVVDSLRKRGRDVLTSQEAGNAGRSVPDLEVLEFAIADQRAVITLNRRHFVRLHHEHPQHDGIIVCSYDSDFEALAARIDEVLSAGTKLEGQLIRINRTSK